MRQPQGLIEPGHRRMRLGSQLHGGGTQSIRRLQFMPSLQPLTAVLATANMHIEATLNRLGRKFDLILLGDVSF